MSEQSFCSFRQLKVFPALPMSRQRKEMLSSPWVTPVGHCRNRLDQSGGEFPSLKKMPPASQGETVPLRLLSWKADGGMAGHAGVS